MHPHIYSNGCAGMTDGLHDACDWPTIGMPSA